jgi:hypothetical protein
MLPVVLRESTGVVSLPIYQKNGRIESLGAVMNKGELYSRFYNEFLNSGDEHDYFASTVNVEYVSPLFFMFKKSDFIEGDFLNIKDFSIKLTQRLTLCRKSHVLFDSDYANKIN